MDHSRFRPTTVPLRHVHRVHTRAVPRARVSVRAVSLPLTRDPRPITSTLSSARALSRTCARAGLTRACVRERRRNGIFDGTRSSFEAPRCAIITSVERLSRKRRIERTARFFSSLEMSEPNRRQGFAFASCGAWNIVRRDENLSFASSHRLRNR